MTLQTPYRQKNWPVARSVIARDGSFFHAVLASDYFLLGGGIFLAIAVPEFLHGFLANMTGRGATYMGPVEVSLIGSLIAIVVGHFSLARFTSFPTIDVKMYIVPAFLTTYASVLAVLYLTLTPFGRYHFGASLLIVIPWYFLIMVLRGRILRRRIAFIGEEGHPLTKFSANIETHTLTEPVLRDRVSAIVFSRSADLDPAWEYFIAQAVLNGVPVHDSDHMMEVLSGRVELRNMREISFGSLLPSLFYVRMKRPLDFIVAAAALLFAIPVILFFAALVRLESPGPAIYRQRRMGFRGNTFTCYKLRSMRVDHDGPHFTSEGDSRITRVGRFMRHYHIDELPQIVNILRGDMSWIGPRPEAYQLAVLYEAEIPHYIYRHSVRPGLTGWAAVHQGNVAEVDAATVKLQYDFFYIKYCSIWLDGLIVVKTIKSVLTGFGTR